MSAIINRFHEAQAEGRHGFTVRASSDDFNEFREAYPHVSARPVTSARINVPGHLPARVHVIRGHMFGDEHRDDVYVNVMFMLPSEL